MWAQKGQRESLVSLEDLKIAKELPWMDVLFALQYFYRHCSENLLRV